MRYLFLLFFIASCEMPTTNDQPAKKDNIAGFIDSFYYKNTIWTQNQVIHDSLDALFQKTFHFKINSDTFLNNVPFVLEKVMKLKEGYAANFSYKSDYSPGIHFYILSMINDSLVTKLTEQRTYIVNGKILKIIDDKVFYSEGGGGDFYLGSARYDLSEIKNSN